MPEYQKPSFNTLKNRIEADFGNLAALIRRVFATVLAKTSVSLHVYLQWIDEQNSPITCVEERLYDWASLYSVNRLDATVAFGNVVATGNVGAIVLKDAILRADNGLDYVVTSAVTLIEAQALVSIKCLTAGAEGNLLSGQVLNFVDPMAGINNTVTVDLSAVAGGAAQEDVEAWRLRVIDEWQTVTTYGARSGKNIDYKAWSKSAHPSVTDALVQKHTLGYGSVLVRLICNDLPSRSPSSAVIETVEQFYLSVVPATADWYVTTPIVKSVNIDINLDNAVDTAQNRLNIESAIRQVINQEVSELSELKTAELDAAIASVTTQYTLISPTADISVAPGEVFVLSTLVFS